MGDLPFPMCPDVLDRPIPYGVNAGSSLGGTAGGLIGHPTLQGVNFVCQPYCSLICQSFHEEVELL